MSIKIKEAQRVILQEANRMQGYADLEQRRFSETGSELNRVKMHEYRAKRDGLIFSVEVLDRFMEER